MTTTQHIGRFATLYRAFRGASAALLLTTLLWSAGLKAQTIVNGDFETGADLFVTLPGYLNDGANPSAIPGWIGGSGSDSRRRTAFKY